ncbi:DEAD/DEAH box helicase [Corynebacterium sp.]|uniref:DEAD/DEAH box helicase n=1 Tax=Corynebacterium sp. TaxID=1720 RepID=UPI0026DC28EB|nr:DEAD/DEAH box helicase [Corynebacterium sp.]MDO4609456.1 DEAD/DEAH box helicase [Corynebacterium sp.]
MDAVALRALLDRADRVTAVGAGARALNADAARIAGPWSPPAVDLPDGDDLGDARILLFPPAPHAWPRGLLAGFEAASSPGAAATLNRAEGLAARIAVLRDVAADAAPGLFGRLFRGGRTRRAEAAAAELAAVLDGPGVDAAVADAAALLDRAGSAARIQETSGVPLLPGGHGCPPHLLEAVRGAVARRAGLGDVEWTWLDPDLCQRVLARARTLAADPDSEPNLRAEAERRLRALAGERAGSLLAGLPVDALKTVTDERLRFSGLEQVRVTTVADVLRTPEHVLRTVPGIGERTARRLRAAAQTLRTEAESNAGSSIGDEPTSAAVQLVRVLHRYDQVDDLDEVERARRSRLLDCAAVVPETTSPEPWPVALSGDAAGVAWSRFLDDLAWADAHPQSLIPVVVHDAGDAAWADYLSRPAHYQGLLASLLQREVEGAVDLDASTLQKIRDLHLDRTHLRDLRLRGYQSFGARFALVQRKVVLGDEMGLGKTVQALAAAAHVAAAEEAAGVTPLILVVCPAAVVVNWIRESRRFTDLMVHRAHGAGKDDAVRAWADLGGICVCTFDGARTIDFSAAGTPSLIIVDEAHMVKNPEAQRSRAVAALVGAADHALLLTGTPLENRVSEFANLVRMVQPDLLDDERQGLPAAVFRSVIAPAYLRRNQDDVLDELPELVDQIDWVALTAEDRRHYDEAVAQSNWMAMRRAPMTTPGSRPAKLERIRGIVDEAAEAGRRVLVFSFFLDVLEVLRSEFGDAVVGVLTGSVPPDRRQEMVDEFGRAPAGAVLLSQITAGGTGLNIQAAGVVVLVEPQVKPTIEDQAIARVHRMGQTSQVVVHRLVGDETADERLLEILADKRRIFDAYARSSETAEAPDAVDVSEGDLARTIIAAERRRLGFDEAGGEAEGPEPDYDGGSAPGQPGA